MQRIAAHFRGGCAARRRMIGQFIGTQTMHHKHSLWIETPLPGADQGIFGNSGDLLAKSTGIFPDGTLFSRRSARFLCAGDGGLGAGGWERAMGQQNDGAADRPRRPQRSFFRRCGRAGRWLDGRAASAGAAIRVTVTTAGAERVPGRETVSGPFQSVAAQAEARPHKMAEGSGKSPDLSAHTVSSEGALGWQRAIAGPPQGHWRKRPLGLEDFDGSTIMASGGDEAIEVDFVGQTAVEVVIEAGRACVAALLQARSDTPFHAPGLVHEVCVLGRRAPDQARRLPTNHRPVVDRAGDKAIAVVDTVDAGVLVEHEAAPALTGSGHD